MKAFFTVTGRGLGGDAVVALNTMAALRKRGVECIIGLDKTASSDLFEKNGFEVCKISIPHAGGHSATKLSAIRGALKLVTATFKAKSAIKKSKSDFVVAVLGGGAIVGCFGAKICGVPAVTLSSTPLDYKVCTKLNHVFIVPELSVYRQNNLPRNVSRTFFPVQEDVASGNAEKAFERLKKESNFDENKKTILFSSGSTIFKGTVDALANFSKAADDYNLVLIGLPLKEEFLDLFDKNKVIYLGYIDWIKDLYKFVDLAVITDDGLTMQESLACKVPSITLTRVKYGRYHNLEAIFKGAVVESEVNEITEKINYVFKNYDSIKKATDNYSKVILSAGDDLVKNILEQVKL